MTARTDFANAYAGKTVAITGATGLIGHAVLHALRDVDCTFVLHSHSTPIAGDGRVRARVFGDVALPSTWQELLAAPIDVVFHLAAHEHRHGSEHDPVKDEATNARAVLLLLERCVEGKAAPRIVFASSSNLVGNPPSLPVTDETRDDPLTLFGIHKLMAERYLRHYARESGIPSMALRLANLYGPLPSGPHALSLRAALNIMSRRATRGEGVTLFANRRCIRDYLYLEDVGRAFLAAGAATIVRDGSAYIVASGRRTTIEEAVTLIVDAAQRHTGAAPTVTVDEQRSLGAAEMRDYVGDASRFRSATGWEPLVDLPEGIDRTVRYFVAERAQSDET